VRAVDKAYLKIKEGIISGHYPAGTRITEQEIVAVSGVSRTPVREALRRLQAEGLVDFTPNLGAMVTVWTQADSDEVFELRAMLEAYGARRAARLATPEQLARLRELAEAQHQESIKRHEG
jgi:DNA-binding GntR family transcriptional regulator